MDIQYENQNTEQPKNNSPFLTDEARFGGRAGAAGGIGRSGHGGSTNVNIGNDLHFRNEGGLVKDLAGKASKFFL